MNRILEYFKTVKVWAGFIGAIVTAIVATLGANGDLPSWVVAIPAICTAIAVYEFPYQPGSNAESVDRSTPPLDYR